MINDWPIEQFRVEASASRWRVAQAAAICLALTNCSAILAREHDQCRTSRDCHHLGVGAVCTAEGICASVSEAPPADSTRTLPASCRTDADCGASEALCASNGCFDVASAGCSFIARTDTSNRISIAVLLPDSETETTLVQAAVEAATKGWSEVEVLEPSLPGLLALTCSPPDSHQENAIADAFPIIVAPTRAPQIERLFDAVWNRSVVFAPLAEFPSIPTLATRTNTHVVSCKPNRTSSEPATLTALARVRSALDDTARASPAPGTVIAISKEEIHLGYEGILASPAIISNTAITYDSEIGGADLVSRLQQSSLQPGLLAGVSSDADWSSILRAVEVSSNWSKERPPFYFTVGRSIGLLKAINENSKLAPRNNRVAILDYHTEPRHEEVRKQLSLILGTDATPDQAYLLDCFFLAAYSAIAAQLRYAPTFKNISAQEVFLGVSALVGGKPVAIGPDELLEARASLEEELGRAGTLDLIGASGDLDFLDLPPSEASPTSGGYLAPAAGSSELFCVDAETNDYCATGLLVTADGELSGVNRCSCFGQP